MSPNYDEAVLHLIAADPKLARLIERVGPCSMEIRDRITPFQALLRSIMYQQLAGKAAATILGRFLDHFGGKYPKPEDVLALSDEQFRGAGVSRNKTLAIRDLAQKTLDGIVPPRRATAKLTDQELIERLVEVRGVGVWTVEMLLIFSLGRPDVLPLGDYGVRKGYQVAFKTPELPTPEQLRKRGERWRPWRSVASWYLWRATEL